MIYRYLIADRRTDFPSNAIKKRTGVAVNQNFLELRLEIPKLLVNFEQSDPKTLVIKSGPEN